MEGVEITPFEPEEDALLRAIGPTEEPQAFVPSILFGFLVSD